MVAGSCQQIRRVLELLLLPIPINRSSPRPQPPQSLTFIRTTTTQRIPPTPVRPRPQLASPYLRASLLRLIRRHSLLSSSSSSWRETETEKVKDRERDRDRERERERDRQRDRERETARILSCKARRQKEVPKSSLLSSSPPPPPPINMRNMRVAPPRCRWMRPTPTRTHAASSFSSTSLRPVCLSIAHLLSAAW